MPLHKGSTIGDDRVRSLFQGLSVDKVPLYPFLLGFCARNVGYPISCIYNDPIKSYEAQALTLDQYGFDWGPMYGYASYGSWEFGGEVRMPSGPYEQAPMNIAFPVQSESDVEMLTLPDVDTSGSLPLSMAFSKLQKEKGSPITIVIGGNFTIAGGICPLEKLCRWMLKKPELTHRILRLATDHTIQVVTSWVKAFGADQIYPQIWEPLASNNIISPKQFEKFVFPYLLESSKKILGMGVKHVLYHVCGEQNKNLPFWAEVSGGDPGIFSIGSEISIESAIGHVGSSFIVAGNISPTVLQNDTPTRVYELCVDCLKKGMRAPRGFMLMSGCEIPPNSPPANVYAMNKAINDIGRY